jgi:hypothetical protein
MNIVLVLLAFEQRRGDSLSPFTIPGKMTTILIPFLCVSIGMLLITAPDLQRVDFVISLPKHQI